MSTTSTTLQGIEQILAGEQEALRPRRHVVRRMITLSRDNPLGAFGMVVIVALFLVGTFGPGLDVKLPFVGGPTLFSTPTLTPHEYDDIGVGPRKGDPSMAHPFGTDVSGRDMLARVVAGARISLLVGFISVLGGVAIGMVIGIASGYFGGWVDGTIQRSVDTVIAFPGIVILLILMSILDPSKLTVTVVILLISIFPTIRIVRGATLSEKNNQYIEAARAIGSSPSRILFRHLMPNVVPLGIVIATTGLGAAILAESALGFLGLGIPAPNPSWGTDISAARNSPPIHIWWAFFPGLAISLTVLGFNLLGDAIRDIADPRLRGARG
jgi:ABC-type dipeptide/oligopeptide/nickel transport system permease subunit